MFSLIIIPSCSYTCCVRKNQMKPLMYNVCVALTKADTEKCKIMVQWNVNANNFLLGESQEEG